MTDLPVQTVPNQEYGAQTAQREAQQAVPMGAAPQVAPPPSLTAPTARPSEPVQAGLPTGAGPGPEALGNMNPDRLTRATLQALHRRFPSPTIERLMLSMKDG